MKRDSPLNNADAAKHGSQRQARLDEPASIEATNIQAVVDLERQMRLERTILERLTDVVSAAVSSTGFILVHLAWFSSWIALNLRVAKI